MSIKRPIGWMALVLALVLPQLVLAQAPDYAADFVPGRMDAGPPLLGSNSVSNLELQRQPDGRWKISFDYFFTGAPPDTAVYVVQSASTGVANQAPVELVTKPGVMLLRGQHRMTRDVDRPADEHLLFTREVRVELRRGAHADLVVASDSIAREIEWPDHFTMGVQVDLATIGVDGVVKKAAGLIDTGTRSRLEEAHRLLEKVIEKDPTAAAAYLELARVAMKTNWTPEGLRQAEGLIQSALQLRPTNPDAQILLGYVYANQKRFPESEAQFAAAAASHPRNLWLWANWGEMLQMQDRIEPAIEKYREAVKRPPTGDSYDAARQQAYQRLFWLLGERKDLDGVEALHKQRVQEYSGAFCSAVDYARFLVQQRGNSTAAIALLRDSAPSRCASATTRQVLGLAHYAGWAASSGPEGVAMLHQARVYFPVGASLFYQLASSEGTLAVAQGLVAAGERIDQRDNRLMDALAYALSYRQYETAGRLLRLGASPQAPIGNEDMPVGLMPVLMRDAQGVRLMQGAGVDYAKLRFRDSTGIEIARSMGDAELLKLLDPKAGAL